MNAITKALDKGMEITIHSKTIEKGTWKGSGYVVNDPLTGSNANLIEGGMNGGGSIAEDGFKAQMMIIALSIGIVGGLSVAFSGVASLLFGLAAWAGSICSPLCSTLLAATYGLASGGISFSGLCPTQYECEYYDRG
jgi:hypothetical protein